MHGCQMNQVVHTGNCDVMENKNEKIPHYVNEPTINRLTAPENKLVRPDVNYIRVGLNIFLFVVVSLLITYAVTVVERKSLLLSFDALMQFFPFVCLVLLALCLRFIIIWFISLYQRYAKSETRLRCCFTPSCSEYAILALRKYGVLIGGIKAIKRLRRCRPPGGIDYP